MSAYLFSHFVGENENGEQIYFSISRDGLHWKDLNHGNPILYNSLGTEGVRDPFLVRDPVSGKVFLMATDLRISAGNGWTVAQYQGSRNIIIWESDDLIHWSKERSYPIGIPEAGCVWAPEAVYDSEKESFLLFFASMVQYPNDKEPKQRIYASYTKDFCTFSDTFLYMEKDSHVIDSTMLEENGYYYRITKDETNSRLVLEKASSLRGTFQKVAAPVLDTLEGVEGPEGYLLPDGKTWCIIADRFLAHKGYLPMLTTNLAEGEFKILEENQYDMGETRKRHGGVLQITDLEYESLLYFYDRKNPVIEGTYADPDLVYLNHKYYIYPTTDGFENWTSHYFEVFSSTDCKSFTKENQILDVSSKEVPWATGSAWAPCVAEKDGMYYFYFCAKDETGESCIGVAESKTPIGPFVANEKPLLTRNMVQEQNIKMSQTIDPSIYQEDNKYYLVFGNCAAAVVELTEDMKHIKENTMWEVKGLEDFRESLILFKRNGIYHFTWSCDDTRSENYHINYGIADTWKGPVQFKKTILQKDMRKNILGTGHHSIVKIPEQDKYMIAYHRFGTPLEKYPEGKGWNREICIAPLEFDKNGLICKVITN